MRAILLLIYLFCTVLPLAADSETKVTFIANAGFLFESGGKKVAIDSVYGFQKEGVRPGVYQPAPYMYSQIEKADGVMKNIDLVLITHSDLDHHHRKTLLSYLKNSNRSEIVMPFKSDFYKGFEDRLNYMWCGKGAVSTAEYKGVQVTAIGVKHIGRRKANHQGYSFQSGSKSILHLADVGGKFEEVAPQIRLCGESIKTRPDIVMIAYWALETEGVLEEMERVLKPEHIILMHVYKKHLGNAEKLLKKLKPRKAKLFLFRKSGETRVF